MDVVRDFRRGAVRLHVLHHAAEGEVSGAWLAAELAEHGYRISPGTLYPLLHDLEAAGLLSSVDRVDDGHARRWYLATDTGRATLAEANEALRELATELLGGPPDEARGATGDLTAELGRLVARLRRDHVPASWPASRREAAAGILSGLQRLLEDTP